MTRSTSIRTFVIPLVFSTSTGSSCFFPFVKAVIARSTRWDINVSCMVKQRTAIIRSPGIRFLKIPQFSVKNLSEVLPSHAFDTNDIEPCGVISIRIFTVLWCLYEENFWARATSFAGMKWTPQSNQWQQLFSFQKKIENIEVLFSIRLHAVAIELEEKVGYLLQPSTL